VALAVLHGDPVRRWDGAAAERPVPWSCANA